MIPENLIFLQVVPHDLYFEWQIEVQITNFRKFGVSDKMHILVWYPKTSQRLPNWAKLQAKYPEVKLHMYEDSGVNLGLYISQLRPHTLKKHFSKFKEELKDKIFFYHDSDIIFRELPDFEKLCSGDTCWQSNTSSYLDYSYLTRKEREGDLEPELAVKTMAEIGGVSVQTFKDYDGNTGGAQCILRNIDSEFWEDVERMCIDIRKKFFYGIPGSINHKYFRDEAAGFQSWCADMWALNMAMWKRGQKTDCTPDLDFSWATDSIEKYYQKPIFHNAGATPNRKDIFYKGAWINRSPLGMTHEVSPKMASFKYVEAMYEVNL